MSRLDSIDEAEPFLPPSSLSESIETPIRASKPVLVRLYISHSLSTWNSRMFEFGAVLFLASIFPGTLLYASVYALVRSLSAVLLSSWLGSMVDRSNRLKAIRLSIIWQRLPVALSCACFVALLTTSGPSYISPLLFAVVTLLACFEKLAYTANTVAVERDWAIVVSDALQIPRQDLNASMRRIDLFCKLLAPVVISLIDSFSTRVAIWTTLGINASCVLVEYFAIAQVYKSVPELVRNQETDDNQNEGEETTSDGQNSQRSIAHSTVQYARSALAPWREYVSSPLFLSSFALSLLYLTVLSFGTTMVTYLLHTGFNSLQVSGMRIGAVIAELSGTWAAPFIMNRIGPIRSGLWFLNWQFTCLAAAVAAFAFLDNSSQLAAVSLIVGVALSRVGLWGFDLSVQFLVQEGVDEHARARFSSTEMALQNIFELFSFATTIVFPLPEQFKYPVFISYGAIAMAAVPKARGTGRSGPRRRTGCLTCRARKVRCDEAKPTCANCTRLRLQCIYKTIVPGIASRRSTQSISQVPQQAFTIDSASTHVPDRLDVNYFDTVLQPRELRPRRASHILPHQVTDHVLPSTSVPVSDFPSFDMLGFIGEITSDFEQKHLDLTNGVSAFTLTSEALSPTTPGHVGGSNHIVQQPTWTVDTSVETLPSPTDSQSEGVQNVLSGDRTIWPETRKTYEEQLLSHFAEIDPPPTTFGSIALEWNYAMGEKNRWRAAPVYHRQASSEIQSCVTESMDDSLLKRALTAVFLLMLSEVISSPDLGDSNTSYLHSAYLLLQRFHHRTKSWTGFGHLIVSWISLLDVRALIAGRDGDPLIELGMLDQAGTSEMDQRSEDELLSKPGYLIHNAIVGPAYSFLFKAQQVIRRIVCLDMHHRRRGTVSDEFEVLQVAHQIGADLEGLWNKRPRVLDVYDKPEELYNTLQPVVADEVSRTFRQYIANFLAIFIYLHRVAFVIYPRTDRVHRAVDQIIQLATVESGSENHRLPISFTWPLFVAGLEGSLEQRGWIIQEMQRMADLPSDHSPVAQRHPNAKKILQLLEEMTKRQDASRTWADSRLVRRELFVDPFVLI
ncbi:hypothetical protein G4B84_008672 [Aspergillus flavus NRRL3357]|nr:uncharacterized protein G4B84_008672 [Aspergillus flavus NRRL3357]QMW33241.1 hypothetical protein G4B84_008672 [Aspergillus flavus NRRL3357]QMW45274.1 hypothetical protein G4B11_008694 [Aspergillus flavus]